MYEVQYSRRSEFDWAVPLCVLGLMVIGTAFVYSAMAGHEEGLAWYKQTYLHQIAWYVVGLGAAAVLMLVDYGKIARWGSLYYWASIVLLIAVLVAGTTVNGAKRWIFGLQPSEFAKIAFIFFMANLLGRPAEELKRLRLFLTAMGFTVLPFLLIKKEPDLGSALVIPTISIAMMFVAGVSGKWLAWLLGGVAVFAALVIAVVLFAPAKLDPSHYQERRILEYFGLKRSYNVEQSLISVGSGGFTGKGWRHGTQYSLGFLPRAGAHNDFLFSVIGEEEGFIGSVVVLTLYAVLLFSGIKIASQARDHLGRLLAVGVVTLLFCHVFINIGMNIRMVPVAGIPLPLLSYGGSSVVCSLIAIGILHNIHIYRRSY